jgi:hypothetical protein
MRPINILLIFCILIELLYIAININRSTVCKFKVKQYFGNVCLYKLFVLIILITLILIIYACSIMFKTNVILTFTFISIIILLFIEYKLTTNHNISEKTISRKKDVNDFNTGDIIIFETPQHIDTWFSIIPVLFININHIGIAIKDSNNKLYLLECENNDQYCNYSNRVKNGVVLVEFDEILKLFDDSYLLKTSVYKHIQQPELITFLEKYKDYEYMEDNMNCITFVSLFVKDLNLMYNNNADLFFDYKYFLNKENYINDFNLDIYKII